MPLASSSVDLCILCCVCPVMPALLCSAPIPTPSSTHREHSTVTVHRPAGQQGRNKGKPVARAKASV